MMQKKIHYKYLTFVLMLYMTIKLTTVILIYKVVDLKLFVATASTMIMPLWFVIGDIIAEVYGYRIAKNAVWMAIICQFIFAFLCYTAIGLESPLGWEGQEAYNQVLGKLPRVATASFLAILGGAFVNAYAISKWKILLQGRYFWLRSFGASVIGELIFTIIAYSFEFIGVTSISNVIHLMTVSFIAKLIFTPIMIIPSSIAVVYLKKAEGVLDGYTTSELNDYEEKLSPGMQK